MSERDIPKSEWGPGPWQDEPDQLVWRDERTGLWCCILRNMHVTGNLCGYVGVPPGHAFHGWHLDDEIPATKEDEERETSIDEIPIIQLFAHAMSGGGGRGTIPLGFVLRAHGGVSWSGLIPLDGKGAPNGIWYFGFDAGHAGDVMPRLDALMKQITPPGEWAGRQRIFADNKYRTIDYMKDQCAGLAFQLRQLETRVIEVKIPEFTGKPRGKK